MKTIDVELKGLSPLLMHSFPLQPIPGIEKKPAIEQAKASLYLDDQGRPCIPAVALQRCLVGAATYVRGKGRASLTKVAAAALFVEPVYLALNGVPWVVDSRPVTVPATRGRIIRHRPRFDSWKVRCQLIYDELLLSEVQLREIVDNAGSRVGLLDFRPERRGPFGRFSVVSWG